MADAPATVAVYSPLLDEMLPEYCLPSTVTENDVDISWLKSLALSAPPPPPFDLPEFEEEPLAELFVVVFAEAAAAPAELIVTLSEAGLLATDAVWGFASFEIEADVRLVRPDDELLYILRIIIIGLLRTQSPSWKRPICPQSLSAGKGEDTSWDS